MNIGSSYVADYVEYEGKTRPTGNLFLSSTSNPNEDGTHESGFMPIDNKTSFLVVEGPVRTMDSTTIAAIVAYLVLTPSTLGWFFLWERCDSNKPTFVEANIQFKEIMNCKGERVVML